MRTVNSLTNVLGSIGYYVLEQASSLVVFFILTTGGLNIRAVHA